MHADLKVRRRAGAASKQKQPSGQIAGHSNGGGHTRTTLNIKHNVCTHTRSVSALLCAVRRVSPRGASNAATPAPSSAAAPYAPPPPPGQAAHAGASGAPPLPGGRQGSGVVRCYNRSQDGSQVVWFRGPNSQRAIQKRARRASGAPSPEEPDKRARGSRPDIRSSGIGRQPGTPRWVWGSVVRSRLVASSRQSGPARAVSPAPSPARARRAGRGGSRGLRARGGRMGGAGARARHGRHGRRGAGARGGARPAERPKLGARRGARPAARAARRGRGRGRGAAALMSGYQKGTVPQGGRAQCSG